MRLYKVIACAIVISMPASAVLAEGRDYDADKAAVAGMYKSDNAQTRAAKNGIAEIYTAKNFADAADATYRKYPNYVMLAVSPPPEKINWTNYSTLTKSIATNITDLALSNQTNFVGHVTFEFACTYSEGRKFTTVSGETPNAGENPQDLRKWLGYNMMFDYIPGDLESREDVEQFLSKLSAQPLETGIAVFLISPESCQNVASFFKSAVSKGVYRRYSIGLSPKHGEGASCASLGAAVTEMADLPNFSKMAKQWSFNVYLPKEFITKHDEPQATPAAIWKFRNTPLLKEPAFPYKKILVYDPERIYIWILKTFSRSNMSTVPVKKFFINKSPALILDYRNTSGTQKNWSF